MRISSQLPKSIGHLKSLSLLSLRHFQFNGPIPASFGNLTQLIVLDLASNNFSGELPDIFENVSNLELLDFSDNKLQDLETLDLKMNNFVGAIPDHFSGSNSSQSLHLNNNQFEGRLPLSLIYCKKLKILDVGANKIEDEFPNVTRTRAIDLSNNMFDGEISHVIDGEISHLDLSSNRLTGEIPFALTNLNFFEVLNLSQNQLVGEIPRENDNPKPSPAVRPEQRAGWAARPQTRSPPVYAITGTGWPVPVHNPFKPVPKRAGLSGRA
ncbi:MDIS1-interacting receptor like kinase 2-like [Neltuma alba]|uniref:MDIS1-interacting receptor like kinase 2-like n=1 Tax=Neltuma alba TaxID=207710 RepID=UPI0010A4044E|nr:MDIS1-interacting receptor like kinase 2-like [Prosopis alba]